MAKALRNSIAMKHVAAVDAMIENEGFDAKSSHKVETHVEHWLRLQAQQLANGGQVAFFEYQHVAARQRLPDNILVGKSYILQVEI